MVDAVGNISGCREQFPLYKTSSMVCVVFIACYIQPPESVSGPLPLVALLSPLSLGHTTDLIPFPRSFLVN